MAELRTEEEQLDAIKEWWKSNGSALLVGIVIAAAGVFGWQAWQRHQEGQSAEASNSYQQLIAIASSDTLDDNARTQAFDLADNLQSDHGDTLYADLAGLLEAKIAVNADDTDRARQALNDVIDDSDRPYMQGLARIDLARLQMTSDDPSKALETLEDAVPGTLEAQRQNVLGDAYLALERSDDARKAYQQAQSLAQDADQTIYGLQLKLDDLGAEDATR
ncbi:YfgM family protein [Salinicola halimionae]|uniref:YfgM family protein n=1 Tax=Salinicola halimionae TaxID=1949081 RepID=UPI000DA1A7BA|nr:tetratricopeptide repeat protein [Salinicola halimionae]